MRVIKLTSLADELDAIDGRRSLRPEEWIFPDAMPEDDLRADQKVDQMVGEDALLICRFCGLRKRRPCEQRSCADCRREYNRNWYARRKA